MKQDFQRPLLQYGPQHSKVGHIVEHISVSDLNKDSHVNKNPRPPGLFSKSISQKFTKCVEKEVQVL